MKILTINQPMKSSLVCLVQKLEMRKSNKVLKTHQK